MIKKIIVGVGYVSTILLAFNSYGESVQLLVNLNSQTSGEEPQVRIENLEANSKYSLLVVRGLNSEQKPIDQSFEVLFSKSTFNSNTLGVIDLKTDTPESGYEGFMGADPWGFLWSMKKQKLEQIVMLPGLSESVFNSYLGDLNSDKVKIFVVQNGSLVKVIQFDYKTQADGVREVAIDPEREQFVGKLFLPENVSKKVPGLVIWHGSGGAMPTGIAKYYASRGYAALAVKYFTFASNQATPYLTDHIRRTPLEIVENAIDWLAQRDEVDPKKLAIYGGSRGGELALLAGQRFSNKIAAIIALRPPRYAFGSKVEVQNLEEVSSWTYRGQDIPYTSILSKNCTPMYIDELTDTEGMRTHIPVDAEHAGIDTYRFRDGFLKLVENHKKCGMEYELNNGLIDTTKIAVPIMATAGTEDQMWPAEDYVKEIQQERMAAGFVNDLYIISFGAGHVGGIPGDSRVPTWTLYPFSYKPNVKQSIWVYGGSPKANHDSALYFTNESLKFLQQVFN